MCGPWADRAMLQRNPLNRSVHSSRSTLTKDPMMSHFSYTLEAQQGHARAGTFMTPHGPVQTPVFMPVGTTSAVKSLTFREIHEAEAQIVLANAYHTYLRPGHELIARAGGLHGWTGWNKPILTDSGGFQVFSLSKLRKLTEEGVKFRDAITGQQHMITPERSMEIQNALGADVIMAFDECPPYPATYDETKEATERTARWFERCLAAHQRPDQALFPIIQGGTYDDLRDWSLDTMTAFPSVGIAVGGVSVGEPKPLIYDIVKKTVPKLPTDKPHYLMGVGEPEDLLYAINYGIDMFDCVQPTRVARHGSFFSWQGRRNIKNAEFREKFAPLEEGCDCYTCQNHHAAYVAHLMRIKETVGGTLLSIHNVRFLIRLAQEARQAILAGRWDTYFIDHMAKLQMDAFAVHS